MADLKKFQEDELDIIISLPYRVGLWMSRVDNIKATGRDERLEDRALEAVLETLAQANQALPFAALVVKETLKQRRQWIVWQTKKKLTEDLRKGLKSVEGACSPEEALQYKKALLHIAHVVAQAYGEQTDHHEEALLVELMTKVSDRFADPQQKNPENISPVEKAALQKLKEALKS